MEFEVITQQIAHENSICDGSQPWLFELTNSNIESKQPRSCSICQTQKSRIACCLSDKLRNFHQYSCLASISIISFKHVSSIHQTTISFKLETSCCSTCSEIDLNKESGALQTTTWPEQKWRQGRRKNHHEERGYGSFIWNPKGWYTSISFWSAQKKVEQQASNSKEVDAKQGAQNAQKVEVADFKIDPNKPFEEAGPTNLDKPLNSDRQEVAKTEARNRTSDVFKANVVK